MKFSNLLSFKFILIMETVFSYVVYDKDTCKLLLEFVNNQENMQKFFVLYPHTKILIIKNTTLTEFPPNCSQLKDIERVYYVNNRYTQEYSNMKELINVTDVYINGCNKIPECLDFLPNLKFLNLKNNRLNRFPTEVLTLHRLEVLDLSFNYISSLPKAIENLRNLHTLFLSRNTIAKIYHLAGLPNLSKLNLHMNKLTHIPVEIGLLSNLTYLDLSDNAIKTWYSSEKQVNSLVNVLKTEQCNIPAIYLVQGWEKGIFNLQNLEYLKITDNCIEDISLDFNIFTKLQCISLKRNLITGIPIGLKMESLTFLDLHGNNIQWGLEEFIILNPNTYVNLI